MQVLLGVHTLSAVARAALPGEEAEGTVPRVLELAVRHRRSSLPYLQCQKQPKPLDLQPLEPQIAKTKRAGVSVAQR